MTCYHCGNTGLMHIEGVYKTKRGGEIRDADGNIVDYDPVETIEWRLLMVRNLISLKIFSFPVFLSIFPGRACVKNGFPLMAIAPTTVKITSRGERTISASKDSVKSKNLFPNFAYIYVTP